MPKTRKQSRRSRRKTFKRKSRKGGFTNYTYLIDYLKDKNNRTIEGIEYVLNELKGREGSMMRYVKYWRDALDQLNSDTKKDQEYIDDSINDLIEILKSLVKEQREQLGGSISTYAIKVSVPEPSNKIV